MTALHAWRMGLFDALLHRPPVFAFHAKARRYVRGYLTGLEYLTRRGNI